MREELGHIDVSAIADLVRIKREEEVLRDRLARMETAQPKVSAVVFKRVRDDYERRQAAFDEESRPLKERARIEYAKLRGIRAVVEAALEEAALEKEELEFRHQLGEYPDEEYRRRLAEAEKRFSDRKAEMDEIGTTAREFADAFHSPEELEQGPAVPPPAAKASPAPAPATTAPAAAPPSDATVVRPMPVAGPPPRDSRATAVPAVPLAPPASPASAQDAATIPGVKRSELKTDNPDETRLDGRPPMEDSPDATRMDVRSAVAPMAATAAIPSGRLIVPGEDGKPREHPLGSGTTSIGRSPKNHICIPLNEVSRHHADLVSTDKGFKVVDAGSNNGIYVNGARVTEQLLADGDIILIGKQKLTFKA